jgi:DNA-binding transcriptional ArsR family regulator
MARPLHHPTRDQIELSAVLDALSDPTRRQVVLELVERGEDSCSAFTRLTTKSNLSYHYARLREAGVTRTRAEGTLRVVSLRLDDLEMRFPGLMAAIIEGARRDRQDSATPLDVLGRADQSAPTERAQAADTRRR